MPTTSQTIGALATPASITFTQGSNVFTLPLDASNPNAWQDFLNYLLAHPELIMAVLQLIAMLLGGIAPPPPPTP